MNASETETRSISNGPSQSAADRKPEAFTNLKGQRLVRKDHPIIILRGKLDSLAARIISAQICARREERLQCVEELQGALELSRRLLSCEYAGQAVGEFTLGGLDSEALRERSHNPMKFFGHRHLLMDYRMGPLCSALNDLRTFVREAEIAAVTAFDPPVEALTDFRGDIISALNRLSSFFYILMYKYMPADFEPGDAGI